MRKKIILIFLVCLSSLFGEAIQQFADLGNFKLVSGDVIQNCTVGYRSIGTANSDSSNIIIYPTWFGGTSEHIITAIETHKIVDPEDFLIIAIDALGNGVSSSPSNYQGTLPQFSIEDMVHAQHRMLTRVMGIDNIYGIVGGSMGSFQAFQWLVSYPEFAEKAIPYVCSPALSSSDKFWLNLEKEIILLHDDYDIPGGKTQRIINLLTTYAGKTQNHLCREIDSDAFSEYYADFTAVESAPFTLENRLSQINAMLQHDITRSFDHSLKKTAQQITADMLVIVSDSDQLVNPQPALEFSTLTGAELLILSNECGHLAPSCDIEKFADAINTFLRK